MKLGHGETSPVNILGVFITIFNFSCHKYTLHKKQRPKILCSVSDENELKECLGLLIEEQMEQCGDVLSTTLYSTRIR